jgi:hypothetical protein
MLAGIFFVLAAIASIPALALYHSVLHDPKYIVGSGPDTQVLLGACCEIVAAISVIGTATVLFPIIRRQSEGMALLCGRSPAGGRSHRRGHHEPALDRRAATARRRSSRGPPWWD